LGFSIDGKAATGEPSFTIVTKHQDKSFNIREFKKYFLYGVQLWNQNDEPPLQTDEPDISQTSFHHLRHYHLRITAFFLQ